MELRHLRYFVTVAEELHFSRAAVRLQMAQPPLSQQIQQLEAELGIELFHRKTKRQVQLTIAGQVFLEQTYQLLAQLEQAVELTRRTGRGEVGQLVVGFTSIAAYGHLPTIVQSFRSRVPGAHLVLQELTTPQQEQALHDRRLQIGFVHPPLESSDLNLETIWQESLVVALPVVHPLATQPTISIQALPQERFILFPRHLSAGLYDQILAVCQQANFRPNVAQEAVQMQTIVSLVSAGMGIALVPASLQNLQRVGVIYRPLQEPTPTVTTAIAWQGNNPTPMLQQFLAFVRTHTGIRSLNCLAND